MKQEVVVLVAVVVTGVALAFILQLAMLNVWGNEVMMMSTLFYSKQFHHANTALLHVMCQSLMISLAIIWRTRMRRSRRRSQWLLTLVVVLGFLMCHLWSMWWWWWYYFHKLHLICNSVDPTKCSTSCRNFGNT